MSREPSLAHQLKHGAASSLEAAGFVYDGGLAFRKLVDHGGYQSLRIVEFQAGLKGLAGRFTVNLGVFAPRYAAEPDKRIDEPVPSNCLPAMQARLGSLLPPWSWIARVLDLGFPLGDRWWSHRGDPAEVKKRLQAVAESILRQGSAWFEGRDRAAAFEAERARLDARSNPANPTAPR